MQMCASDTSCRADQANRLPDQNFLTFLDSNFAQVAVHRHISLTMVEQDRIAIEEVVPGSHDSTRSRCRDWFSIASSDV